MTVAFFTHVNIITAGLTIKPVAHDLKSCNRCFLTDQDTAVKEEFDSVDELGV